VERLIDYNHSDGRWVYVSGPVLLNTRGATLGTLVVSVPVDQPRAIPQTAPPAAEPTRAIGTARPVGTHRADDRTVIERGGRLYRRMEFPR